MKKLRYYLKNKSIAIGSAIILIVVFCAIFAPLLTPYDPELMDFTKRLQPPSSEHWLGTDTFGRDYLTRLLLGARVSLLVGIVSVSIAMAIGVTLGLISGYFGKFIDSFIMRIVDIFLSFPVILLAIALVAALGPGILNVMIAIGLVYWTNYARVVRSSVLNIKEEEYILAARTMGASNFRIIYKYILPVASPPIIVVATLGIGVAIVSEATLSFLGLGIQPPAPSWGWSLSVGLNYLQSAPHLSIFPGIAIMITVLGFNLLGDGIRDVTDPKLRK